MNNAGRSQRALFEETSLDIDREVIELNVLGVLSLTKQVLPHMLERKEGHIAVMSSIAGKLSMFWSHRKIVDSFFFLNDEKKGYVVYLRGEWGYLFFTDCVFNIHSLINL